MGRIIYHSKVNSSLDGSDRAKNHVFIFDKIQSNKFSRVLYLKVPNKSLTKVIICNWMGPPFTYLEFHSIAVTTKYGPGVHFIKLKRHLWHLKCQNIGILNASSWHFKCLFLAF